MATSPKPTKSGYIDAHCHLADPRLASVREEVLGRAAQAGITRFIQGGVGPEDWALQREVSRQYPGQLAVSFGLHPWWIAAHPEVECESALALLKTQLSEHRPCGLGELGLDYGPKLLQKAKDAGDDDFKPRQLRYFKLQLKLGLEQKLPLILHIVHAHSEALQTLLNASLPATEASGLTGIVHSYSEDLQTAERYLKLGLKLSISGSVITRKSGKAFEKLRHAVLSLPLESFVLETDSPDQPPADSGFDLNEPVTLLRVAREVGHLKQVSAEAVLDQSRATLEQIFLRQG